MKKFAILAVFLYVFSLSGPCFGFWIWSPKSKKWRNPKYSPLAAPEAQFQKAMERFEVNDFKTALVEFRKVVQHFADSKQAPEAQYYIGKCYEALGDPYQAFVEYQKVIDSYPYSERISEIVDLEYKIGDYFLNRQRNKWLGIVIDELFEHPSIGIFTKVIENAPYSQAAQASQYKLGLLYKGLGRYEEAIDSFTELIEKYPESKWNEPAKYQLALCSARASLKSDYDQELTQQAKERFEEFLAQNPDAEISEDARKEFDELRNKEAEKFFNIAVFYDKQHDRSSAEVYYKYVMKNYPDSAWAEKANQKLEEAEQ